VTEPLPSWLLLAEAPPPAGGAERFTDRGTLSLVRLLSAIRRSPSAADSGLSPLPRLAALLAFVVSVSVSRKRGVLAIYGVALLAYLSAQGPLVIARSLKAFFLALVFTSALVAPSLFMGNAPQSASVLALKASVSVLATALFASTTAWASLSSALAFLRLPAAFALTLDLCIRYIYLLGELALSLLRSYSLRSVGGRRDVKASGAAMGGIVGSLFLKSSEMTALCHAAMECRCFSSAYPRDPGRLGASGVAYILGAIAMVALCVASGVA
jgi:cobalt/nickel transport system permease protein